MGEPKLALAPDTIAWGGLPRGVIHRRVKMRSGHMFITDHGRGASVDGSTCTLRDQVLVGTHTRRGIADADRTASAMESVAETYLSWPRLSRLDLARDVPAPGQAVVDEAGIFCLDRGYPCEVYWTGRRRGLTMFPEWADRVRVYDKGLEATGRRSDLWRVEVQLRRGQLRGAESIGPALRRTRPWVERELPHGLRQHGLAVLLDSWAGDRPFR